MPYRDTLFVDNVASMLEELELQGMQKPVPARIGLRSGTLVNVQGVKLLSIDGEGVRNFEVVAYQPQGKNGSYDEVRFLASDVESVTRTGLEGVSPERADDMHSGRALEMVEAIMTPEREETMDRFRRLGAICTDTRPDWFTEVVRMQIAKFDAAKMKSTDLDLSTLEALLSDDVDEREVTAAVMIIMVDMCYNALEHAYEPYIGGDEWTEAAMALVDGRLDDLAV
jgi:hypothetical protein